MKKEMINETLRLIRLYWGKSQIELAQELKLSQPYLSELERGEKEVTLDVLQKYSARLRIPMSSLLLFAERIDGVPEAHPRRAYIAGKTLNLLKKLLPHDVQNETI